MKRFLKIFAGIVVALVVAIFILAELAPEKPGISSEISSGGKSVIVNAWELTSEAVEGGRKITFGDHVVTVVGGVFKLDGKVLEFGTADRIEIILSKDGKLSVS